MIKIDTVNVAQPVDLIAQYKDVFEGFGIWKETITSKCSASVPPVQLVPRRIPVGLKEQLKVKLDSLVAQRIITPVTIPLHHVLAT